MLSPELIEHLRREEERRREQEGPVLRIPVERPMDMPEEAAPEAEETGGTVVVVNVSHADLEDFTVARW